MLKVVVLVLVVCILSGCAAENCFRTQGSGMDISIGCTEETQPITKG